MLDSTLKFFHSFWLILPLVIKLSLENITIKKAYSSTKKQNRGYGRRKISEQSFERVISIDAITSISSSSFYNVWLFFGFGDDDDDGGGMMRPVRQNADCICISQEKKTSIKIIHMCKSYFYKI